MMGFDAQVLIRFMNGIELELQRRLNKLSQRTFWFYRNISISWKNWFLNEPTIMTRAIIASRLPVGQFLQAESWYCNQYKALPKWNS